MYIGNEKKEMLEEIRYKRLVYSCEMVDIREIDCRELLGSDKPGDYILSILCGGGDNRETIREVLRKLGKLGERERIDYLVKLTYLSSLRRIKGLLREEVKKMPIAIDIKDTFIYEEGVEEGIEKGRREDIINLVRGLNLSAERISEVLKIDIEFVKSVIAESGL